MAMQTQDVLQLICGDRLPIFRATTRDLSAVYPFQSESGLIDPRTRAKVPGLPVGYCGRDRSGGIFYFDPVQLYLAGLIADTNVKVFGKIGKRKSTGIKCEISRGIPAGYNHLVTDRKGEYTPLAESIPDSKILRFGTDTTLFINPLDASMSRETQNELVAAMALTAMGGERTKLTIVESSLLWHAIAAAHAHPKGKVAILPDLVDQLFQPHADVLVAMHRPDDVVVEQGYKLALGLQRLTIGDMRGMFHRETTPGLFDATPLLVLNCEGLKGETAVIMITLINFFSQSQWGRKDSANRFHKVFHDEAWDLAAYPGFVESVRRSFKLGGTWGVANYIIAHHKSNLDRSGANEAIRDLISDSSTTILYQQDRAELEKSADELGLSRGEVNRVVDLPVGRALYKIGSLPGIEVEQIVWPEERKLVETRELFGKSQGKAEEHPVVASTDLARAM